MSDFLFGRAYYLTEFLTTLQSYEQQLDSILTLDIRTQKQPNQIKSIALMGLHELVDGSTSPGFRLLGFQLKDNIFNLPKQPSFYLR